MEFRSEVKLEPSSVPISHKNQLFFIGSCFSQNIGQKLESAKFPVAINPYGVLFNPVSVSNSLFSILENRVYTEDDLSFNNGLWFSYDLHGSFANQSKTLCLQQINDATCSAHQKLLKSDFLFVTLGTAWVYYLVDNGKAVANCHKQPSKLFEKKRLEPEEVFQQLSGVIKQLQIHRPSLQIYFTVSPVRHWRDGAHENNLSKSSLLLAIDKLTASFGNCHYFPAYELVLDDLRDYRFYDADMMHPNSMAVDYIWEKFSGRFFSEETRILNKELKKIEQAYKHRPFNPDTDQHKSFLKSTLNKVKTLSNNCPYIFLDEEIRYFSESKNE